MTDKCPECGSYAIFGRTYYGDAAGCECSDCGENFESTDEDLIAEALAAENPESVQTRQTSGSLQSL